MMKLRPLLLCLPLAFGLAIVVATSSPLSPSPSAEAAISSTTENKNNLNSNPPNPPPNFNSHNSDRNKNENILKLNSDNNKVFIKSKRAIRSSNSFGLDKIKPGDQFIYHYETQLIMQGDINRQYAPAGFAFESIVKLTNVYDNFFKLSLESPRYYSPSISQTAISTASPIQREKFPDVPFVNYDLYAHVEFNVENGTAFVENVYVHKKDPTTYVNLKKSILTNLLPTKLHSLSTPVVQKLSVDTSIESNEIQDHAHNEAQRFVKKDAQCPNIKVDGKNIVTDDNFLSQPELFSPDSYSQVFLEIVSAPSTMTSPITDLKSNNEFPYQQVNGYQNVTFRSRIYDQAQSQLQTEFKLKFQKKTQTDSHQYFEHSKSIVDAIESLDAGSYSIDSINLRREKRRCISHHCGKSLLELFKSYRDSLTSDSLASVEASIAYLQLLDRLRSSEGTSAADIGDVLKKLKNNPQGLLNSLLDILAAARTKDAILASLKYLNLSKNKDLDTSERFLTVLSVSAKIAAKMRPHNRRLLSPHFQTPQPRLKISTFNTEKNGKAIEASVEFIAQELLFILKETPAKQWKSHKLRWSTLLTLSSLVNAYNSEHDYTTVYNELNQQVAKLLLDELKECKKSDTDCRVVAIQGIGNIGDLNLQNFQALKEQILESGKRESIASMKALRDCLRNCAPDQRHLNMSFYGELRDLLIRVVYDQRQETTARILAAELIIKFIPDSLASQQLLVHLPSFGNHELATLIWSRIVSLRPDAISRSHDNWYWKSCIINGTSASFIKNMASTQTLNVTYSVNIEVNRKKILKESSFDVMLDTDQRTQDLLSLSLFARGLGNIPGVDSGGQNGHDGNEDDSDLDESAMAGMNLRVLGNYLRPYVFFTGQGELLSHIWSGTASEPTTAFAGDLLLIDHNDGYPLINGFVVEQQMRGVLSIDVTGMVKVSLWNRNSNSVVRTKAAVSIQSSQTVFTSHDDLWSSHLFSFGGQALIDFIADVDFYSQPVRICIQVMQPEFKFRLHTRKYEQLLTKQIRRRFWKRSYKIGAKSYSLNRGNNEMCSLMNEDH